MAKTVEQWRDRTPKGFIFAAKVPQVVTHQKVLMDTESDLKAGSASELGVLCLTLRLFT
jgi:uncharacterized protein YecE (DUF72 family)